MVSNISGKLGSLDLYMETIVYEISKFNVYIKYFIEHIFSQGQTSYDLMNHIFKGYKACYDPQFFKQIDSKEEKHEEW